MVPSRDDLPPVPSRPRVRDALRVSEQIEPGAILVAVDGSVHAERAVHWAAEQASLEGRRLVAVAAGEGARSIADDSMAQARQLHPELSAEAIALPGDPREVLIELSSRAHLLVIGSRGRGALKSMLLGSVSAAVSTHATCPVVVCRPPTARDASHGVIVGADGTRESLPVIEFAFRQASLRGLPLTVLHCFWDVVAAVADYHEAKGEVVNAPELEELHLLLSESIAGFTEMFHDVPVTLRLKHGLVDEALSPRGKAWDLIVVGRHPMTTLSRILTGSIATAVVERAGSTVAVVPEALPSPDLVP